MPEKKISEKCIIIYVINIQTQINIFFEATLIQGVQWNGYN